MEIDCALFNTGEPAFDDHEGSRAGQGPIGTVPYLPAWHGFHALQYIDN